MTIVTYEKPYLVLEMVKTAASYSVFLMPFCKSGTMKKKSGGDKCDSACFRCATKLDILMKQHGETKAKSNFGYTPFINNVFDRSHTTTTTTFNITLSTVLFRPTDRTGMAMKCV